jgi:flagellar hook-basal body complex protein FliE
MRILAIQNTPKFDLGSLGRSLGGSSGGSFADVLNNAVGEVNRLQAQADRLAEQLASGEIKDVHQVMVAMERASLALQLTVQVRNKVIEAYQEMMRTQV